MTRRSILSASAAVALARPILADQTAPAKGRVKQSACRWCYQKISLDDLCRAGAEMGLSAIDLVSPEDAPTLKKYGLVPSMIMPGGGDIPDGFNRRENHDKLEAQLRERIPKAAAVGAPNIITFSGNRRGMSDQEGLENTVIGLNRVKKIGEDHGVTICLELLNSKVDHHDYMCDHTKWGAEVIRRVDSPRVKLLYDIYHMQIMEGDIIRTIRDNIDCIAHFHTGGVPGRHELDDTQELQWRTVAKAIADLNFQGYMAHEFVPTRDPLTSLHEAVRLCTV
ncbi:MAG TPA: TIM barrel protein [Bryobacteraceae bacterium]|nr:TIM barrel protein [Bryobacteraceae bacterium]